MPLSPSSCRAMRQVLHEPRTHQHPTRPRPAFPHWALLLAVGAALASHVAGAPSRPTARSPLSHGQGHWMWPPRLTGTVSATRSSAYGNDVVWHTASANFTAEDCVIYNGNVGGYSSEIAISNVRVPSDWRATYDYTSTETWQSGSCGESRLLTTASGEEIRASDPSLSPHWFSASLYYDRESGQLGAHPVRVEPRASGSWSRLCVRDGTSQQGETRPLLAFVQSNVPGTTSNFAVFVENGRVVLRGQMESAVHYELPSRGSQVDSATIDLRSDPLPNMKPFLRRETNGSITYGYRLDPGTSIFPAQPELYRQAQKPDLRLYLSSASEYPVYTGFRFRTHPIKVGDGISETFSVAAADLPVNPTYRYVIAVVDGTQQALEVNENDNVVIAPLSDTTSVNVYFDITYVHQGSDADFAFVRAANTWKAEVTSQPPFRSGQDRYVSFGVSSEQDFKDAWQELADLSQEPGHRIVKGNVLTHAVVERGTRRNPSIRFDGLSFVLDPLNDGILDQEEIEALPRLNWDATDGELILSGCNTALKNSVEPVVLRNWAPAEVFANSQRVKTWGTNGFSSFSARYFSYVRHNDRRRKIYLWAYRAWQNLKVYHYVPDLVRIAGTLYEPAALTPGSPIPAPLHPPVKTIMSSGPTRTPRTSAPVSRSRRPV